MPIAQPAAVAKHALAMSVFKRVKAEGLLTPDFSYHG